MKHIVRNFLPQDTRAVEFPSAFALFSVSAILAYGFLLDKIILNFQPSMFWVIVTFLIGFSQLISLIKFPDLDTIRTACNWIAGTFWIWVAFSSILSVGSIVAFYIGASNLMAFLINTTVLSETWNR